ncbi:MAG: DNA polymerase III subunit beta, partial [Rhabdochlamydiaceae bacterium]
DYSGDKFEISFNPQNFLDILKHIKDESFFFGLTDPYNPGLIKDSSQSLFIIMPMRLDG